MPSCKFAQKFTDITSSSPAILKWYCNQARTPGLFSPPSRIIRIPARSALNQRCPPFSLIQTAALLSTGTLDCLHFPPPPQHLIIMHMYGNDLDLLTST